jgi:hypothetical protein
LGRFGPDDGADFAYGLVAHELVEEVLDASDGLL